MKKPFTEQRTAIIENVLNLVSRNSFETLTLQNSKFASGASQAGMMLNLDQMYTIFIALHEYKITITKDINQLLYD